MRRGEVIRHGTRLLWSLFIVSLALPSHALLTASSKPIQLARLAGLVVDDAGTAVSGATVSLVPSVTTSMPPDVRTTSTDSNGRFAFDNVPPAAYRLIANKPSYLEGAYGRATAGGSFSAIQLGSGENRTGLRISIWRPAFIAGQVTDERGDEIVGATVQFLERTYVAGRPQFVSRETTTTDDRGDFRSPPLKPANFAVCVRHPEISVPESIVDAFTGGMLSLTPELREQIPQVRVAFESPHGAERVPLGTTVWRVHGMGMTAPGNDAATQAFPMVFYPDHRAPAEAGVLQLKPAENRSGLVIQLRSEPTARVSGVLRTPQGPRPNVAVRLVSRTLSDAMDDAGLETAMSLTDPSGTFLFPAVPPGEYEVRAVIATGPTMFWANQQISVGTESLDDLAVALHEGLRITGRVQFLQAGAAGMSVATSAAFAGTRLVLEPANGHQMNVRPATLAADGTFSFGGLQPGRYFVRVGAVAAGWVLRDAISKNLDVSDEALELTDGDREDVLVTFTDHPSELSGRVVHPGGQPDPAAIVAVFPVDQRFWKDFGWAPRRLKTFRTDAAGGFTLAGLPAGQYYVAAYPSEADDWRDIEEMFAVLSRYGQRVEVKSDLPARITVTTIGRPKG